MENKIILYFNKSSFITQRVFNSRFCMENQWWNIQMFNKKQITKPFFLKNRDATRWGGGRKGRDLCPFKKVP